MKKSLIAFAICLAFSVSAVFAGSGAELFASKCAKCHGRDAAKTSGASGGVMLKGQSAKDLKAKLMGYKDDTYGGKKKKNHDTGCWQADGSAD
jgi:cytochrome c